MERDGPGIVFDEPPEDDAATSAIPIDKRTRHDDSDYEPTHRTRKAKKQRTKQGVVDGALGALMSMPVDIFYEISSHLHPLDVLQLSRTSGNFRTLLMKRSARSVWKTVLAAVDKGLPPCPDDMAEPKYAALLFDRICFLCGNDKGSWVDHAIGMRLCTPCRKANIVYGSRLYKFVSYSYLLERDMLACIPCVVGVTDYNSALAYSKPEFRTDRALYFVEDARGAIHQLNELRKDQARYEEKVRELSNAVQTRHINAAGVIAWLHNRNLEKQKDTAQLKATRFAQIKEKLAELGYMEDEFPADDEEEWAKLVNQPKPLTDRIWANLRPKLEMQIELEQERRIQAEYNARVNLRFAAFVELFNEYLEANFTPSRRALMPNEGDLKKLPSVRALILPDSEATSIEVDDFYPVLPHVLHEADVYLLRAKQSLVALMQGMFGVDRVPDDPDDALGRYVAFFACIDYGCSVRHATFEELHQHWRERHSRRSWFPCSRVAISNDFSRYGRAILTANRIPEDTPRGTLDEWVREGRLWCDCGDPELPQPENLNWSKLLHHVIHHADLDSERFRYRRSSSKPFRYLLKPSHPIFAGECIVKLVPVGMDTTAARARRAISDELRAAIEERLGERPAHSHGLSYCRVCKYMLKESTGRDAQTRKILALPDVAEGMAWHVWACHEKDLEAKDIKFV